MTASLWSRVADSLRFDGLWLRKCVYLGSAYGPDWLKLLAPPLFAALIFTVVPRVRRGAIANIERTTSRPGRWRVRLASLRMCVEFAYCMSESMEQHGPSPRPVLLELRGRDLLADALQQGKGAILLTAHLGNWEIAASRLSVYGRPVNMVMGHEVNPTAHDYARQVREQAPVRIIYSDTSVFSSLKIVDVLRRNEIVAIQLDRPLGMGGTREVPFFGVPVALPAGPFALARLSGAPMIPVFVPRIGRRHYAIHLGGMYGLGGETRGSLAETRAMEVVARVFEQVVRQYPTQWFQFASFWPTQPRS